MPWVSLRRNVLMITRPTGVPANLHEVLPPLEDFAAELITAYPTEHWWPAETSFEVMAGAVLVQNTRWSNVERALAQLRAADCLSAEAVSRCPPERLQVLIQSAGCQSVKARRLGNLAHWLVDFGGHRQIAKTHTDELRTQLLGINGIGTETADVILNFACGRPVFVADRYAQRLFARLGYLNGGGKTGRYETVRAMLEAAMQGRAQALQDLHAATVLHCQQVCGGVPRCSLCRFQRCCHRNRAG